MEAMVRIVEQPEGRPRSVAAERALRELDAVRRFVARGPYGDRGPYGGPPR